MRLVNIQGNNKLERKAFTLIELLAVIVILSVIALITTPIVLNIVEKSRKGAFEDSAYGVIDAVKLHYADKSLDGKVVEETFAFPSDTKLKITGEKPKSGSVKLEEDGKVALAISNGVWCAVKAKEEEKVTITDYSIGDCVIESEKTPTPESCFTVSDDGEAILDYTCTDQDVIIPKKINGVAITVIGGAAFENKNLTSVIIPNGITSIWMDAFNSNQLTSVTIPDSVISIEMHAFSNNQLTNVNLGNSVTNIGGGAFYFNQLTSVVIPNSVISIGYNAFSDNQLTSVNLGNSITSIGIGVFNNNQLPDEEAFIYARNSDGTENKSQLVSYGGAKRDNVIIPANVTSIGDHALSNNQLTSIKILDSVISIGTNAFYKNQLASVEIPNSVTSIGKNAFAKNQLTSVNLGNNVTSIGEGAFYNNQLTSVEIPNSVASIGYDAFFLNQPNMKVTVNKAQNSISGSPWGAKSVEWVG